MERTDRLAAHAEILRAGEALREEYESSDSEEDGEPGPSDAVVEVVRLLASTLRERGLELTADFAASAAQFEGWGAVDVLQKVASPDVLAALEALRELPQE